ARREPSTSSAPGSRTMEPRVHEQDVDTLLVERREDVVDTGARAFAPSETLRQPLDKIGLLASLVRLDEGADALEDLVRILVFHLGVEAIDQTLTEVRMHL